METKTRRPPWLPLGVAIGAAMGSATGQMGFWVAVGAALGVLLTTPWKRCLRPRSR